MIFSNSKGSSIEAQWVDLNGASSKNQEAWCANIKDKQGYLD